MPPNLHAAHKANDAAVLAAYGLAHDASATDIQTLLFGNYAELVED